MTAIQDNASRVYIVADGPELRLTDEIGRPLSGLGFPALIDAVRFAREHGYRPVIDLGLLRRLTRRRSRR